MKTYLDSKYFLPRKYNGNILISGLRTYFITGRASTDIVPLDTRLARRTSSTPATFLLPPSSITNKATAEVSVNVQVAWNIVAMKH